MSKINSSSNIKTQSNSKNIQIHENKWNNINKNNINHINRQCKDREWQEHLRLFCTYSFKKTVRSRSRMLASSVCSAVRNHLQPQETRNGGLSVSPECDPSNSNDTLEGHYPLWEKPQSWARNTPNSYMSKSKKFGKVVHFIWPMCPHFHPFHGLLRNPSRLGT